MKVKSTKKRGTRNFKCVKYKHKSCGKIVKTKRPFAIEPIGGNWWFCLKSGEWQPEYNGVGGMSSSYYSMTHDGYHNVYSLKAAKRLIAKWDIPKGTKFRVNLPFIGYNFVITK